MKSLLNQKTGILEVEDVGDILLASDFWDCDCPMNYIKDKNVMRKCLICGAREPDSPDSRLNEVLAQYPHLKEFRLYSKVWLDKNEIYARIEKYEREAIEANAERAKSKIR